jgi:hypothetical protein
MKSKLLAVALSGLFLTWGAGLAQAGVIRATGKQIGKGSAAVAKATPDATGAVAGGVATAGKTTGGVVKTGATSVSKGAARTPGLAARGTAGAGKALWKAVW